MTTPQTKLLKDKEIRKEFIIRNKEFFKKGIFINEYGIHNRNIIDLAFFDGKYLYGFEIKSEADTLNRLTGQLLTYNTLCDYLYIITHSSHKKQVYEKLNGYRLDNVGVIVVDSDLSFTEARRSYMLNPLAKNGALLRNLSLDNLIDLCLDRKLRISGFKPTLANRLASKMSLTEIRKTLYDNLKLRYHSNCPKCQSNLTYNTSTKNNMNEKVLIRKCFECSEEYQKETGC